jgi:hypothetical protein
MSQRQRSCEECFFRVELLCALELTDNEVCFREASPPPGTRAPRQRAQPRLFTRVIAGSCIVLPRNERQDQIDEWADHLATARGQGRSVILRTASLLFGAVPALAVQLRWRALTRRFGR